MSQLHPPVLFGHHNACSDSRFGCPARAKPGLTILRCRVPHPLSRPLRQSLPLSEVEVVGILIFLTSTSAVPPPDPSAQPHSCSATHHSRRKTSHQPAPS